MRGSVIVVVTVLGLVSCHEGEKASVTDSEGDADTLFVPQDSNGDGTAEGVDVADVQGDADNLCVTAGGFGCPCTGNGDCLDELCIEGPAGNFCTKPCVAECPPGHACLNTSLGGGDPVSICVPQHTRLCRPCEAQSDCQSPLDATPAACVPGDAPEDGSFCATSCVTNPCPPDYDCEDVTVGEASSRVCRPTDGTCECRADWADLGLTTGCARTNEHGTCEGNRVCDDGGLTACSAAPPVAEVCDGEDEDCDGATDDVIPVACTITNAVGACPGMTACDGEGNEICAGRAPAAEICNSIDDDCNDATDEAWPDCQPGGCFGAETGYVEAGVPTCVEGHCVNANPRPCGNYTCDGGGEEGEVCATSCVDDDTCVAAAHCEDGACVPDIPAGEACEEDIECASGHCQNGFCCDSGDCCQQPTDCPASYTIAATCDETATCQGSRKDARCESSECTSSDPIEDDTGCGIELIALDCTPALPRLCTGTVDQVAPECASGCGDDSECIDGFHCDGQCVPDVDAGDTCDEDSDCAAGVCADGVCCNEACEGSCRACDVAGSEGSCIDVPDGQDPDSECGAVACTGYYFGFVDKTCYLRAPVSEETAACDGDGACGDDATVCAAAAQGAASTVCHADCQEPTAATCAGTTPGACTNITGGTVTCGVGACAVTIDNCSGGAPQVCTPGAPTAEVCDGIDNDCDGKTDAADEDLVLAACENQAGVCAGATHAASLCNGGAWAPCGQVDYLAKSPAYQAGVETSCETNLVQIGLDNDCDGAVDDDFTYTSPAGTTIQGAAKACGVGVCSGGLTVCGIAGGLICSNDTKIATEICDGQDNDCDGLNDSLDTNASPLQRVNCEDQDGVCAGARKPVSLCAAGQWQPCTAESYEAHDSDHQATETLCDGLDNDCSGGAADNGLTGPLNSDQDGACLNTRQECTGAGGWVDDYASVPGHGLDEAPDMTASPTFADDNCDGIDGDVDTGIFVAFGPGVDGGGCGTLASPCKTLGTGLARAVSAGKTYIYIQAHASAYAGPFDLPSGKTLVGGFNSAWLRRGRATTGHEVTIAGGVHSSGESLVLKATGVTATVIDLFINAPSTSARNGTPGPGKSSYGVHASSSTLTLLRVTINQGDGASGSSGANGTAASGSAAPGGGGGGGANEFNTVCNDSSNGGGGDGGGHSCDGTSTSGGNGGRGGRMDTCCCGFDTDLNATNGLGGSNGSGPGSVLSPGGGGPAGTDAFGCGSCANGTGGDGSNCSNGVCEAGENTGNCAADCSPASYAKDGSGGTGGAAGGRLIGDYWYGRDGTDGSPGAHGRGGGGGGGSGGCDCGTDSYGAGGGGGGAGGCGASAGGLRGWGGGGSFGVFGVSSTLNLTEVAFIRGNGGAGGDGGDGRSGQPGGPGGPGGAASGDSRAGGRGSNGGRGGHSGGGGGGSGGSSYLVFRSGGSLNASGLTYSSGDSGDAGSGGTSNGRGGTDGANGTIGTTGAF